MKQGTKVKLKNSDDSGVVVGINNNRISVLMSNGTARVFDANEIEMFAKGGAIDDNFPPKGELKNKDNFLLKYEKKGSNYEFYIYKPEKKLVNSYEQIKYVCVNNDCPTKMSYNQFINYLYAELYLDDKKYAKGGGVNDCIEYIKNSEAIKTNGYYLDFKNLNLFVGAGDKIVPKEVKSIFLITFNSGGQKRLKAIDTINSSELANNLSELLKIELGIARIIVSEQIRHSKPFTMSVFNGLKNKNIIIADRDTIVCSNLSNKKYAKGGVAEDTENAEMVLNNNKQIKHHTEELPKAIKGKKVPAWVVAKVNRSASDLSDATHYMDGQGEEYARGGYVSAGEMLWNKMRKSQKANFLSEHFTPEITPRGQEILAGKSFRFLPKNVKIEIERNQSMFSTLYGVEYAQGGSIESKIDALYSKSNFINEHFNWRLKLLEMLQDRSIEAYNIYQSLSKEQKEEVLQEQYEVDNDMGGDGDGELETTEENIAILLKDAKKGKKYAQGGSIKNNDICIEKVINMLSSIKEIDDFYIADKKLVVILKEELSVYDVDIFNHHLSELENCSNVVEDEFEMGYGEEYKTIILPLKTSDFTKNKFKKGGSVNKPAVADQSTAIETKNKLKKNFDLPFELAVYVPSTSDANNEISEDEFEERIKIVSTFLSNLFGGFSSNEVSGGYLSSEKGLIEEDVFKVTAFASKDGLDAKMKSLVNQIKEWCKEWSQEAIGLEFEGDLYYLSQDAEYKNGGIMYAKGGDIDTTFTYEIGGL